MALYSATEENRFLSSPFLCGGALIKTLGEKLSLLHIKFHVGCYCCWNTMFFLFYFSFIFSFFDCITSTKVIFIAYILCFHTFLIFSTLANDCCLCSHTVSIPFEVYFCCFFSFFHF